MLSYQWGDDCWRTMGNISDLNSAMAHAESDATWKVTWGRHARASLHIVFKINFLYDMASFPIFRFLFFLLHFGFPFFRFLFFRFPFFRFPFFRFPSIRIPACGAPGYMYMYNDVRSTI